jgi:orotidine-5'-phosphate decarboxylase
MDETTKKVSGELEKSLEKLRTLRDEVRVRAHLAKMDVKDRWHELEPRVADVVEQAAKTASEASRIAVTEAIEALEKLRKSLP